MVPIAPSPRRRDRRQIAAIAGVVSLFAVTVYLIWRTGPDSTGTHPAPSPAFPAPTGSSPGISATPPSAASPGETPAARPGAGADDGQPFSRSRHYPAALAVSGMEEDETRVEAIEALMETWVGSNPRQAAEWAGSLPAGTFRDDALSSLMIQWAGRDPAAAAAWMSRTGVDDSEAASVLAGRWAGQDPAAASAWASTLGNAETRRTALSSAAAAWAATAPAAAAAFAENLPAADRSAAITAVLAVWATMNPSQAASWLGGTTFPSEADRAISVAALVTAWTTQSPAAVSKYINSLPDGPAREAAASQFAVTAAPTAPAEALMWAMNLTDPDQRNQVVSDACESWFSGSPETFRSGIAEAIALMEDPAMRRGVYEMLYERDPAFHDNLLSLADPAPVAAPLPPAETPVPTLPPPSAENPDPLLLLPPDLPDP